MERDNYSSSSSSNESSPSGSPRPTHTDSTTAKRIFNTQKPVVPTLKLPSLSSTTPVPRLALSGTSTANPSPSRSIGFSDPVMQELSDDGVGFVHGVHSSALSTIVGKQEGLRTIKDRLQSFTGNPPPSDPASRKQVTSHFKKTMTTGERGFTLDAWEEDPDSAVSSGVSLFNPDNARDARGYAVKSELPGFPVVLGVDNKVPIDSRTRRRAHPTSAGNIPDAMIKRVYVPKGRSQSANRLPGMRKRAKSFPDLFTARQNVPPLDLSRVAPHDYGVSKPRRPVVPRLDLSGVKSTINY